MRGAWIEILHVAEKQQIFESLPVRGAWIEITMSLYSFAPQSVSLPVRGAWIEMAAARGAVRRVVSRSPCGERGLKCSPCQEMVILALVAPRAGSVD